MSRYIDADLMREIAYQMNFGGRINERELFLFNRALSEMPTVDAVPVSYIYKRAKELKNDDMIYAYTVLNSLIANYRADGERKDGEPDV